MPETNLPARSEQLLAHLAAATSPLAPGDLEKWLSVSRPTLNRDLKPLLELQLILKVGGGRSTRYQPTELAIEMAKSLSAALATSEVAPNKRDAGTFCWSSRAQELVDDLRKPLGMRPPVGYQRAFLDNYMPGVSSLLPPLLAKELSEMGRSNGQLPAGTYTREVLEQLLIDLSWSSSRLEGNPMSLLDTKMLFENGLNAPLDNSAVMLLNHKEAVEYLVGDVPETGFTVSTVNDLQAILMQDLLPDGRDLGRIRERVVYISGCAYRPNNVRAFLEERLRDIVTKTKAIPNPVEASFFLWVHIAYLQPFVDGNKRTSRLSANIPLMLYNFAPLTFLDVEPQDYALAMMGVYERGDVSAAVDMYDFLYRRSIQKYSVIWESMSQPAPVRLRHRQTIGDVLMGVVMHGDSLNVALGCTNVEAVDLPPLRAILNQELDELEEYNCARYRLRRTDTARWIAFGRKR